MPVIITDEDLSAAQMTGLELVIDLACYMFEKKHLSFGKARALANLDHLRFQQELGKRDIDMHYDSDDLALDLKNLGIEL